MKIASLVFAAALSLIPAVVFAHDIQISDAYIRVPPKSAAAGAGFLTITNSDDHGDKLIGAEANISQVVELHTHVHEGDVMRMRKVDSVAVPAGAQARLQPGGDHIMFIGLTKQLSEGDVVPVTLIFSHKGKVTVNMPVIGISSPMPAPSAMPMQMPMDHGHMDHGPMKH